MKVVLLLVLACGATALADRPKYTRPAKMDVTVSDQVKHAEQAWSLAEHEHDPQRQTELWESAAAAFTDVVIAGKLDQKILKQAAYAAVLAWKNAIKIDPHVGMRAGEVDENRAPISERDQKMIAAFDQYATYIADPNDAELVGIHFLKANIYRRHGELDKVIAMFTDILDNHREHEVAESAANLLLDSYNRLHRYDEMLALADKLAADSKFLKGKTDLKTTLTRLKAQSLRKQAEQLEADASRSGDFAKFDEVGNTYLEIYNLDPTVGHGDEALYNAGVEFARGRSFASSVQAFEAIRKRFPSSRLAANALARLGKAYGDIAMYDRAAGYLEEYATKYAREKDARDALSDALFFRKALGDDAKAIDDTRYFIKVFGAKSPQEASNAMWSLTSVYEARADDNRLVKHLREYLARYRDKGGADRVVIAHAKLGQLLWRQSCAEPQVDGLCTKTRRGRGNGRPRCSEPELELTVVPRDPRKLQEALAEYALAANEFEKRSGRTDGDEAAARYYYGLAKLADADTDLEAFLAIQLPSDLSSDSDARAASLKRFDEWIEQTKHRGDALTRKYEAVLVVKDAATSISAAARLGQVSQRFSELLRTGEIPPVKAYSACLAQSTELGWFSESSKLCERELVRMIPDEFPRAVELRGQPLLTAPIIAVETPP